MTISNRVRIKEEAGWLVAGVGFARALEILSDGAFRLFAWLSINAHRPSGQLETTHKGLSAALGKSRRALSAYIGELEQKGICRIQRAANQHTLTRFEINEAFWPYERGVNTASGLTSEDDRQMDEAHSANQAFSSSMPDERPYIAAVREMFLAVGCGKGSFSPADEQAASDLARRGVGLDLVGDALLIGELRKYVSWLNNGDSAPIGSLNYFSAVIEEIRQKPIQPGYRDYLRAKLSQFRRQWNKRQSRLVNPGPVSTSAKTDPG